MRRELSLLNWAPSQPQAFLLGQRRAIRANPPSEYWFAFTDPRGGGYGAGPAVFEIEFKHWCPP